MRVKTGDMLMALILFAVSIALYIQTGNIDTTMVYAMGPVFFPKILIYLLGLLSLLLMFQSVDFTGKKNWCKSTKKVDYNTVLLRWLLVGLVLLYLFLLPILTYVYATMPFLFLAMCLLGPVKPKNLVLYAIVSVAVTLGLQYIFATLLKLFLP
ncbi:tripartite tricarboxylate transporter TctB family protein [Pseudodesulfovibrio sp.]|uniref:tripartite tricarboxylate transporter TctB family protein n=1 Tax=unclassified Pseudodesulfovibrio TaxID=2661612 RepID=UPI003B00857E